MSARLTCLQFRTPRRAALKQGQATKSSAVSGQSNLDLCKITFFCVLDLGIPIGTKPRLPNLYTQIDDKMLTSQGVSMGQCAHAHVTEPREQHWGQGIAGT